jgi:hypothetical protein
MKTLPWSGDDDLATLLSDVKDGKFIWKPHRLRVIFSNDRIVDPHDLKTGKPYPRPFTKRPSRARELGHIWWKK